MWIVTMFARDIYQVYKINFYYYYYIIIIIFIIIIIIILW